MTLEGELDAQVSRETDTPTVTFAFTVTNTGAEPIELQFADACRAEFVVEREAEDEEVWRFTDGRVFAQVLGSDRLDPDERVTYDAEWQDAQSGSYTAIAHLTAREATCEARTTLEV